MTGGNFESDRDDFDSQDQSETFDETNTLGAGGDAGEARSFVDADENQTFEDMDSVEDVTQAAADRQEDGPFDLYDDANPDNLSIQSDAKGG